jgi:hypothetical protein
MSAADAVYIANDPAAQARLREQEALLRASELADAQGQRVQRKRKPNNFWTQVPGVTKEVVAPTGSPTGSPTLDGDQR